MKNIDKLTDLGFEITLHDKMPDVVLYREEKNWIYFVESVTSVGPMDSKRILELTEITENVTAGRHTRDFRKHWHGKQKSGLQRCRSI